MVPGLKARNEIYPSVFLPAVYKMSHALVSCALIIKHLLLQHSYSANHAAAEIWQLYDILAFIVV